MKQRSLLRINLLPRIILIVCAVSALMSVRGAFADDSGPLTFSKDIAPIFQAHCQGCHRAGQIGPMSLLTYEEARPWVKSIRKSVADGTMPPWHADPSIGKFSNDRSLPAAQKEKILRWIEQGAPAGDPKDAPAPRAWPSDWTIGVPDATVRYPDCELPADVEDVQRDYDVPIRLDVEKWVEAVEFKPGNPRVVHHMNLIAVTTEGLRVVTDQPANSTAGFGVFTAGYAPGIAPTVYTRECAMMIPANTQFLHLSVHYHKEKGVAAVDRGTVVGLKFFQRRPKQRLHTGDLHNLAIEIPPFASDHPTGVTVSILADIRLRMLAPHMHYRGTNARVTAIFPDGKEEILLFVPRWDFNWQTEYVLAEPKALPKGSKLRYEARYDNSAANPRNPDPSKTVKWGVDSVDEMSELAYRFTCDDENPKPQP